MTKTIIPNLLLYAHVYVGESTLISAHIPLVKIVNNH